MKRLNTSSKRALQAEQSAGNPISETDPSGITTSYSYDSAGNQTGNGYDWINPSNPSDVRPVTTSTTYDANGNDISDTDAEGNTSSTTYTPLGQVATTTDSNGDVTQNVYDAAGNLVETREQSRDSSGNLVWQDTLSVYDADGRVIAETDPFVEGSSAPVTGTLTTYDQLGNVTQTQAVTGIQIAITGSGSNVRAVLTSPGTVVTSSTTQYDNQGNEVSSTDQFSHETLTTYDQLGRVVDSRTQSVDQNGNVVWLVTQTVYNSQGQVELTTDQFQAGSAQPINATESIYDSLGRTVETIRLQGVQVGLFNATTGQPIDPLNAGNAPIVSRMTNWGTQLYSTKTVYNSLGQVVESVAEDGQVTNFEYDSLGRQTAQIGQAVAPSSVGLGIPTGDPTGTLVRLRTETAYDMNGNAASTTTNIYEFVLPNGTTQLDRSQQRVTQYEYDQFGNTTETIYPDGSTTSSTYDGNGNQLTSTDQMGQTTQYQYDAENRVVQVTLPTVTNPATGQLVNPTYRYGYDTNGNQTSLASPNGGTTTFTFDSQGNQTSRTLPLGQTETMQYDSQNRQTLAVSFEGNVTQYVYDPLTGNLDQKLLYPSVAAYDNGQGTPSETVSYKYDAFGRVVEVDDTVGSGTNAVTSVTTTTYDSQGNVLSVNSPQGTVSYAYDNLGRLTKTMTGQGPSLASETDYTYNALGQLATVTVVEQDGVMLGTPQVTDYEYNLAGNLIEEDLPNGVVDQFTYNNMNQLTKETEGGPGNTPIAEYDYTYRPDGLEATATEDSWFANNGQNVEVTNNITYTYDALDRLTDEAFVTNAEQILGLDPSLPSDVRQWETFNDQYFYDLDSNQVEKSTELAGDQTPDETITSTYDANDRLLQQVDTTASGSTTTNFSYDNTEQTAETVYSGTPSALGAIQFSQQYQYDLQGRMTGVTITTYTSGATSQIEQLTYGYDDNGNRVSTLDQVDTNADSTWDSQTLIEYLNDDNNLTGYSQVVRETQCDPTTGQVQQVVEYAIGPRQISQMTTVYTSGQPGTPSTLYFGYDGHGSVRALLDATDAIATVGGVRQLFNYDAYGNPIGFQLGQAATTVLYSGQQTDAATGLQDLRARYYNPHTDTFTSLDPYAGDTVDPISFNKYLYTQGDPINGYDPTGGDYDASSLEIGSPAIFSLASSLQAPREIPDDTSDWAGKWDPVQYGAPFETDAGTPTAGTAEEVNLLFHPNTYDQLKAYAMKQGQLQMPALSNIVFIQIVQSDDTKRERLPPFRNRQGRSGWRIDAHRGQASGWYGETTPGHYDTKKVTRGYSTDDGTSDATLTDTPGSPLYPVTAKKNSLTKKFETFAVARFGTGPGSAGLVLGGISWGFTITANGWANQPDKPVRDYTNLKTAVKWWNWQASLQSSTLKNAPKQASIGLLAYSLKQLSIMNGMFSIHIP